MLAVVLAFGACTDTDDTPADTTPDTTADTAADTSPATQPETTPETEPDTSAEVMETIQSLVDFVVEVETGRDVRILQLTDLQIIDPGQSRYPGRLKVDGKPYAVPLSEEEAYEHYFRFVEGTIREVQPDLIIVTGDLVYGEFDDSGEVLLDIIAYFERFGIPWAPVFGNHENESAKGVDWQCAQFEAAEHCLFKQRDITGNGNYSIGIVQGGKMVKAVYMMDSNGCGGAANGGAGVKVTPGFGRDQWQWLNSAAKKIDATLGYAVSKFAAFHIAIPQFAQGAYESGYQSNNDSGSMEMYTIGVDVPAQNGDFGTKGETFRAMALDARFWKTFKNYGFDGIFVGHTHCNNTSVLYDGIRLTFGLKTGYNRYDQYNVGQVGGTSITLTEGGESFTVQHVYIDERTPAEKLTQSPVTFSFDIYVDEDYNFDIGNGNAFCVYAQVGGSESYFHVKNADIVKGAWNTVTITLSAVTNFAQFHDAGTKFGIITPSFTTVYLKNITVS